MSHPIEESYTRFVERATALESMADKIQPSPSASHCRKLMAA